MNRATPKFVDVLKQSEVEDVNVIAKLADNVIVFTPSLQERARAIQAQAELLLYIFETAENVQPEFRNAVEKQWLREIRSRFDRAAALYQESFIPGLPDQGARLRRYMIDLMLSGKEEELETGKLCDKLYPEFMASFQRGVAQSDDPRVGSA